jgi:hypothetical protein
MADAATVNPRKAFWMTGSVPISGPYLGTGFCSSRGRSGRGDSIPSFWGEREPLTHASTLPAVQWTSSGSEEGPPHSDVTFSTDMIEGRRLRLVVVAQVKIKEGSMSAIAMLRLQQAISQMTQWNYTASKVKHSKKVFSLSIILDNYSAVVVYPGKHRLNLPTSTVPSHPA